MVDITSRTIVPDRHLPGLRLSSPARAGMLAVSVIALLAVTVRWLAEKRWDAASNVWLMLGAALWVAAVASASVLLRSRRSAGTMAPGADTPFGRGVRRHVRRIPVNRSTTLHLQGGRRVSARIANISVAAVAVDVRLSDLDYAAVLKVGSREVGPIRRTPTGAVFGFSNFLDPQLFDQSFVL